jgi:serine/threonine protein kinase
MLPAHWKTLQPLLDQALDAQPAERSALLDQWRITFPHLIDELQRLLQSHEQAESESFLQGEPASGAGLFATPLAGQRLGAYTLQEAIGEGGMGSVWLARRDDGRFEGVVAVKLLSLSMQGEARAERFRREGHILARLAHPHIARLLDAGVSPSGQPYLVLEHVRGRHIDVHCNEERLGLQARIQLFLNLLDAVQHAHGHLVVHRDIKPSNVMVDEQAQLKLLDFGIAKLMTAEGQTDSVADSPLTQQAGNLLSPGYAAPEQLQSGTVSTATDVYALGVLLYVLLSGHHPTTRPGSSAAQALNDTLQRDPLPMSQAVRGDEAAAAARQLQGPALHRALAGDLDNIAAKALRRVPAERYATAAAFADDLRRYLARQPVLARQPSAGYLLRRFVQRHRIPVAATALGTLLIGGFALKAWQEQQAARLSQNQAQTVDGLLQSLFRGMSPDVAASRSFSAKELLDRAQSFLDSKGDVDAATRRAARLRMALLYRDVGAYKESMAGFQAEEAEATRDKEPTAQVMALWHRGNVLLKTLDQKAAAQVLAELERVVATHQIQTASIQARVLLLKGELAMISRRAPEAQQLLGAAEALFETDGDEEMSARAASSRGEVARLTGDVAAARQHLLRAAALLARRGDDAVVDRLAVSLDLGGLENRAGVHEAAVMVLTPVHADMLSRLGPHHPLTVGAVSELALAHLRLGQSKELQNWLQQLRGSTGPSDAWREDHAATLDAMGTMYSGQAARAEPELRRLLAALVRDEGGVTASTEPLRRMHAEALLRLGRTKEAETELALALKNQLQLSRADHPSVATTRVLLGVALARRGDLNAARQQWESAEPVLRKELGPQHPSTLVAACYGALATADATAQTSRKVLLADQLQKRLGWQDGSAGLAAALRAVQQPPDWSRLPAVL